MTIFKEDLYSRVLHNTFKHVSELGFLEVDRWRAKLNFCVGILSPKRTSCYCIMQATLTDLRSLLVLCGVLKQELPTLKAFIKINRNKKIHGT